MPEPTRGLLSAIAADLRQHTLPPSPNQLVQFHIASLSIHALADSLERIAQTEPPTNDSNPWPDLYVRHDAAKHAQTLGSQLRPDELTERVKTELENAFAAGALWQYHRGQPSDTPH